MKKYILLFLIISSQIFGQGIKGSSIITATYLNPTDYNFALIQSGVNKKYTLATMRGFLDSAFVRTTTKQYVHGRKVFTDSVTFTKNTYFNNPINLQLYSPLMGNVWIKGVNIFGQWSEEDIVLNKVDITGTSNIIIIPDAPVEIDSLIGTKYDNQVITIYNNADDISKTIDMPHVLGLTDDFLLHQNKSATLKYSNTLNGWVLLSTTDFDNPVDTLNVNNKFIVNANGNIVKWGNKVVEEISSDSTYVLYANGKWKTVTVGSVDTSKDYNWNGLHNFTRDSLRINGLWYDFPTTRVANSVLYDSLGNGVLKWKSYISNTIDTTKISYLAKNETFTGVKTISNMLSFGASSYLYLPVADATGAAGYFWRSTNILKYTNSSGDAKSLVAGSGTANQIPYWSDANNLSTLSTTTYPNLTELSYVKGVTSAIQTQFSGKQATLVSGTNIKTINSTTLLGSGDIAIPSINGTGFVKASGTTLSYDNSTYTTTNTTQTISGEKTFSASTGVFTTKLAGYNSSSLTSDINFIDFNGSTSTSGVDITGVKSVVSTSLNPTANQLYGGYFRATGSGTSGGTRSYGIYAEASGSGENYAGYFAGNIYTTGTVTGTFSGNLTGNASTVTNGVYTSGSYSNPSWLTSLDASKITQSSSYRFATDAEKTNWNTAYTNNHTHSNKAKLDSITIAASRINSIPSSYVTLSTDNEWTGYNRFIKNLLTSDTTGLYVNSYTATSGADIKGITSYVYTSSNPTANKIYGGYFRAQGSGTSGGTYSYGIYAEATGSNTNYAGSFVGNVKIDGSIEYTGDKINPFEDLGTSGGAINTAGKTNMKFTYYTSITITSFNDGTDGKEITIYNDGTSGATVTINETGNIITPGSSIVLGQYDNATFKYISTSSTSKWICTSYVDN